MLVEPAEGFSSYVATVFPAGEPYHAHVTFEVEAGTPAAYGDIQVVGIDHLSEQTILRTLPNAALFLDAAAAVRLRRAVSRKWKSHSILMRTVFCM